MRRRRDDPSSPSDITGDAVMAGTTCPACGFTGARTFFESQDLPVQIGVLHPTRESAVQCPLGPMALAHCESCDLVFNPAFDPKLVEYSQRYDNSLFFSPTFQEYSRATAERLVETYGVRGKTVLEIGAGGGDFLRLVADVGGNAGIGIDPASQPGRSGAVELRSELFASRHLDTNPDLICSRYVLEHLPRPSELLSTIRNGLGPGSNAILYFEVPDAFLVLKALSIWDIIYEHCAYYTPLALANLLRAMASVRSGLPRRMEASSSRSTRRPTPRTRRRPKAWS
jgi:SAM-dependent methyltransferase